MSYRERLYVSIPLLVDAAVSRGCHSKPTEFVQPSCHSTPPSSQEFRAVFYLLPRLMDKLGRYVLEVC